MANRHPSRNPHPIRLTATRKALLQAFGEYFLLGNRDLAALLPGPRKAALRTAQQITKDLRERNFLHGELYFDYDNPARNPEWLYCLTTNGLAYAQERGLCRNGKAANEKSAEHLGHDYALTRFHLRLARYCDEWTLAEDCADGMFWITSLENPLVFRTSRDYLSATHSIGGCTNARSGGM